MVIKHGGITDDHHLDVLPVHATSGPFQHSVFKSNGNIWHGDVIGIV